MPGTILASRYELLKALGGGFFGEVWLAWDQLENHEVAVKLLDPSVTLDEVLLESQIMARLRAHPRVATIRNMSVAPPLAFIVMEYLANGSVEARLSAGVVTLVDAARWTRDALDGLAYVHAEGILHRDIKPANLLVDDTERAVLSDFGLGEDTVRNLLANPAIYMPHAAPEVVAGNPSSVQSDLWALGCTFYRLLTGALPFADDIAAASGIFEDPHRVDIQIPLSVSRAVRRALQPDPTQRYPDARAMLADLSKCRVANYWTTDASDDEDYAWIARGRFGAARLSVRKTGSRHEVLLKVDMGHGFRKRSSTKHDSSAKALREARTMLVSVVEGRLP